MTLEKIRDAWAARPFRPFRIHMADGRSVLVRHPELLAMAPSGRVLTVYQPDDSEERVDLLRVASIGFRRSPGRARPRGR
jgi:hypothetical protein